MKSSHVNRLVTTIPMNATAMACPVREVALRFEEIEAGQVEAAMQGAFLAVTRGLPWKVAWSCHEFDL